MTSKVGSFVNKELGSMWEKKMCVVDYFRHYHDILLGILAETIQLLVRITTVHDEI